MTPQEKKKLYNRNTRANDAARKIEAKRLEEQRLIAELNRSSATARAVRAVGRVAERFERLQLQSPFLGNEFLIY